MERDAPEPAIAIRLDKDVVIVRLRQRLGAGEIRVDRQVLKERVPLFGFQMTGQQGGLAAGIDHKAALGLARDSVTVGELHTDGFIAVKDHLNYLVPFQHRDTLLLGVVQQNLVELGTPDLVGMGVPLASFFEVPTPGSVAAAPDHGCAVFG